MSTSKKPEVMLYAGSKERFSKPFKEGADLFHGVPQDLLDLGSDGRHRSRLQLPELPRIGC